MPSWLSTILAGRKHAGAYQIHAQAHLPILDPDMHNLVCVLRLRFRVCYTHLGDWLDCGGEMRDLGAVVSSVSRTPGVCEERNSRVMTPAVATG
jgi:hypothetical protein